MEIDGQLPGQQFAWIAAMALKNTSPSWIFPVRNPEGNLGGGITALISHDFGELELECTGIAYILYSPRTGETIMYPQSL